MPRHLTNRPAFATIDRTVANVTLVDEKGRLLGRPAIEAAWLPFGVATRIIVGNGTEMRAATGLHPTPAGSGIANARETAK
jgi:hypothetical protein